MESLFWFVLVGVFLIISSYIIHHVIVSDDWKPDRIDLFVDIGIVLALLISGIVYFNSQRSQIAGGLQTYPNFVYK